MSTVIGQCTDGSFFFVLSSLSLLVGHVVSLIFVDVRLGDKMTLRDLRLSRPSMPPKLPPVLLLFRLIFPTRYMSILMMMTFC